MTDRKQTHRYIGPLSREIEEFIEFKRQSGYTYTSHEYTLKAFDRFCAEIENQSLSPLQLAEKWVRPGCAGPKNHRGTTVRQLGQYLAERRHPKSFIISSDTGKSPRMVGIKSSVFAQEIKEFVDHKISEGRKYDTGKCGVKAFDKFCAMTKNELLSSQQMADAWIKEKNRLYIGPVREFGLYLTMQGSVRAFAIPYANGEIPKPAFKGYSSLFKEGIESFLKSKRRNGTKYMQAEYRLRDFDRFCNDHLGLTPQHLAEAFILKQEDCCRRRRESSICAIRSLGSYLVENGYPHAFEIADKNCIIGPYEEEISTFVDFKRSCGFKYDDARCSLRLFDVFCASKENEVLTPQQMADSWSLKRGGEHPNTRAGRVGPVRVFGKYLARIGHPKAFTIADDVARGAAPKPPYLFAEGDINIFFHACAKMEPNETDPSMHIVLPAAFLFMHCIGVRTCELEILMENVNLETGEVLILDAKTGDRTVYMSRELSEIISKYSLAVEKIFPHRKYLFPASTGKSRNDFAKRFSEIWGRSVPPDEHGKPRLYDLRHHLLYRNIELCMRNGRDVNTLRPYIMKHMGHKHPESFQYYFHLSPPIRKEVSRIKSGLDWMIPDVPEVPYE
jgi:integrase